MSSLARPHRRRPRSEIEDEEDADILRGSQKPSPSSSDSAKRARTHGYHNDSQSEESDEEYNRTSSTQHKRRNLQEDEDDEPVNSTEAGASEFQPGAIVRVKLANFVTYEKAEFFPGPNLNMVIGPNGTGKSSLVCAICLGLGWGPQHLGRAGQVGEFVKHTTDFAEIEIELQRRHNEKHNHIVRVKITRDGNGREWWLDNKKTSLKAVQALTKSLSIQIDNLCQFLPQDKVSEFAALSPVELLLQTQRAAAPEQMLEWHEALKKLRKDQKSLETQHESDKESLDSLEKRQENLRTEVARLQERNEIQGKVELLKKTIPFVEYSIARKQHIEYKMRKEDAQARLKELEAQVGPTLESIKHKEGYQERISVVVAERKKFVQEAERAADTLTAKIEALDEGIQKNEHEVQAEINGDSSRKKSMQTLQRKISDLKAQLNNPTIEFDPVEWNNRIVSAYTPI
jgi:chromosome segregation ATPase